MHKFITFLTVVFIIFILIKMGVDYNNCDGAFVRGLFWFECIK